MPATFPKAEWDEITGYFRGNKVPLFKLIADITVVIQWAAENLTPAPAADQGGELQGVDAPGARHILAIQRSFYPTDASKLAADMEDFSRQYGKEAPEGAQAGIFGGIATKLLPTLLPILIKILGELVAKDTLTAAAQRGASQLKP